MRYQILNFASIVMFLGTRYAEAQEHVKMVQIFDEQGKRQLSGTEVFFKEGFLCRLFAGLNES